MVNCCGIVTNRSPMFRCTTTEPHQIAVVAIVMAAMVQTLIQALAVVGPAVAINDHWNTAIVEMPATLPEGIWVARQQIKTHIKCTVTIMADIMLPIDIVEWVTMDANAVWRQESVPVTLTPFIQIE